jgi:hypothetical protein
MRSYAAARMAIRVRATLIYLAKRGSAVKDGERTTSVWRMASQNALL